MHRGPRPIIHPRPVHRPIVQPRTIIGAVAATVVVNTLIHPRPTYNTRMPINKPPHRGR